MKSNFPRCDTKGASLPTYKLEPDGTAIYLVPRRDGSTTPLLFMPADIPALRAILEHLEHPKTPELYVSLNGGVVHQFTEEQMADGEKIPYRPRVNAADVECSRPVGPRPKSDTTEEGGF